jgi:hypothetical protein
MLSTEMDNTLIQEAFMVENTSSKNHPSKNKKVNIETINSLIADLGSQDGLVRVKARKSLVAIGRPSVVLLEKALTSKKEWVRWEAAKTLGQIGDTEATATLINALRDKLFDVRWLAAEGLVHIGREALPSLLRAYIEHPDSSWLQEGVHHVLHDVIGGDLTEILQPVILALEGFEPSVEAPPVAAAALKKLTKDKPKRDIGYGRN